MSRLKKTEVPRNLRNIIMYLQNQVVTVGQQHQGQCVNDQVTFVSNVSTMIQLSSLQTPWYLQTTLFKYENSLSAIFMTINVSVLLITVYFREGNHRKAVKHCFPLHNNLVGSLLKFFRLIAMHTWAKYTVNSYRLTIKVSVYRVQAAVAKQKMLMDLNRTF